MELEQESLLCITQKSKNNADNPAVHLSAVILAGVYSRAEFLALRAALSEGLKVIANCLDLPWRAQELDL